MKGMHFLHVYNKPMLCEHDCVKVFWSSGRPLLCFSRFWSFENVARVRRVYVAYSRTKSVHTRNLASNATGKCVFVLIAPNDRITSYSAGQVGGQDKISYCFNERKTKGLSKNGNIIIVQKTKMGP